MTTTYDETGFGQSAPSARRISSFLKSCWDAFQERRQRLILRATLSNLSDRELMDVGKLAARSIMSLPTALAIREA